MRSLIRFRARKEDDTVELTIGLSKGLLLGIMIISMAVASLAYTVMPAQSKQDRAKKAINSNQIYSESVEAGDYVFLSGKIASVRGQVMPGGIQAETKDVLENLAKALANSGLEMKDVVKTTVYLKNLEDYAQMNAVYQTYFPPDAPPARTTVVTGIVLNASVEIDVVAYRGK